jgi:hypothetical protein
MNVNDILDPGFSASFKVDKFDSEKRYLLLHRIKNTKESVVLDIYTQEKGMGYHDDDRLVRKVLRYIYMNQDFNYEAANNLFIKMSTHDIDPVIEKAINDAGYSDYYYRYEKEY